VPRLVHVVREEVLRVSKTNETRGRIEKNTIQYYAIQYKYNTMQIQYNTIQIQHNTIKIRSIQWATIM
jgi:hypothetical protein